MTYFIIRRLIQSFFLVLGITLMSFVLLHVTPGGPQTFTENPRLPKDYAIQERHTLGLDEPLPVQYAKWLWQLGHLNFGRSFTDQRPVLDVILERVPNTLVLSGSAFLIGLIGIPLGVFAALRRGGYYDHALRMLTVVGSSVPLWWLGLVILIISDKTFQWFPIAGVYTPGNGSILDRLHHLLLPATLSGLADWFVFSRFMRSELLEVLTQDYVRTARAKGLREQTVILRHALRNALIPIVTILGGSLAALLSGAVLFEYTFSWPGMGRLAYEAALARDYPVLMALVVISSTLVILGNFLADITYAIVDPRIKYD